jgi:5-formyltetrahydrofolate cyclo-ligase
MRAIAVGVGFEVGRVPSTLPQEHDRPMDWLVTENGAAKART